MAAAPVSVVGEWSLASPELALVDADLAAALQQSLRPADEAWTTSAHAINVQFHVAQLPGFLR
jgi:hypothetical protein